MPEYAIDEVNKHMELIVSKSCLSKEQIGLVFDIILDNLEIIPMEEIRTNLKRATEFLAKCTSCDLIVKPTETKDWELPNTESWKETTADGTRIQYGHASNVIFDSRRAPPVDRVCVGFHSIR